MFDTSTLYRLKRDEIVMLDGMVGKVFTIFIHKCMPDEEVITLFVPGVVTFVFLVADETVLSG